jgi:hypothetical protein
MSAVNSENHTFILRYLFTTKHLNRDDGCCNVNYLVCKKNCEFVLKICFYLKIIIKFPLQIHGNKF